MIRVVITVVLFIIHGAVLPQATYMIRDVTVIPMNNEQVLPHQTVLVRDGKIIQVGSGDKIKPVKDAISIDGKGKYLLPGLFDMHAHFFYEQGEHINSCETELRIMLAMGLTTVRITRPISKRKTKCIKMNGRDLNCLLPARSWLGAGPGRRISGILKSWTRKKKLPQQ